MTPSQQHDEDVRTIKRVTLYLAVVFTLAAIATAIQPGPPF
jgi:hypothetical protein